MCSLFHYTSFEGLKGILDSGEIRLSNSLCLNDSQEFLHSKPIFINSIKKVLNNGRNEKIENTNEESEQAFSIYRMIIKSVSDFYILSTCTHKKKAYSYENGLLSMWRGYGSNGGYAIEFFKDKLINLIKSEGCVCHGEVAYPKSDTLKNGIIPKALQTQDEGFSHLKLLESLIKDLILPGILGKKNDIKVEQFRSIIELLTLIKHPGFDEEKEFRFSVGKYKGFNSQTKLLLRNGKVIEYISVPINLNCIKRVLIGPQTNMDQTADFLKHYAKNKGLFLK